MQLCEWDDTKSSPSPTVSTEVCPHPYTSPHKKYKGQSTINEYASHIHMHQIPQYRSRCIILHCHCCGIRKTLLTDSFMPLEAQRYKQQYSKWCLISAFLLHPRGRPAASVSVPAGSRNHSSTYNSPYDSIVNKMNARC